MKKISSFVFIACFALLISTSLASCSRKTGCPSTENAKVKLNKNGMPTKKSKSSLFPKEMRKKKRKG